MLLTVLLVSCAIAEAGIASYVGVTTQINRRANEEAMARYEEYQEQQKQKEPSAIQYIGPGVQVKNGEVVKGSWEPAQPVQRKDPIISEYIAPEVPKSDIPEIETDLKIKKAEIQPVTPKSSDNGKKAANIPKSSGEQSNGGVSSQQKPTSRADAQTNSSKSGDEPKQSANSASKSSGESLAGGSGNADNFNAHYNPEQQKTDAKYVLNTSTKKFHYPSCNDVKKIAEKNYSTSNDSRDAIINSGYSPCGHCDP